jgi:hypothetical protein
VNSLAQGKEHPLQPSTRYPPRHLPPYQYRHPRQSSPPDNLPAHSCHSTEAGRFHRPAQWRNPCIYDWRCAKREPLHPRRCEAGCPVHDDSFIVVMNGSQMLLNPVSPIRTLRSKYGGTHPFRGLKLAKLAGLMVSLHLLAQCQRSGLQWPPRRPPPRTRPGKLPDPSETPSRVGIGKFCGTSSVFLE